VSDVPAVERIELTRLAGKLAGALGYLDVLYRVRATEVGSANASGISTMATEVRRVRARLVEMAAALPEGPLEAFGREHPLYEDQLDGPYCGYVDENGKRYSCPVRDSALHWDAWELRGTRLERPESARRR
jgi:hypothetical protein